MANCSNSTAAPSPPEAIPTPRDICFKALDEIDHALIDLEGTLSAACRLAETELANDSSRPHSFLTVMERHITSDMNAAVRALGEARDEILKHACGWQPKSNDGGAR